MKKQYTIVKIPKGNGTFRTIYKPSKAYKEKLHTFLLDLQQKVHNADEEQVAHGFIRGRGPVSNALKHVGYSYTFSLDLKNFFDSVRPNMVEEYLSEEELSLCFIDGVARQGLPTSPAIANLAFFKIDQEIIDAIAEVGAYTMYTRYADDLIFSFNQEGLEKRLLETVNAIITKHGFTLNTQKTSLQKAKNGRRMITGIAVDERGIFPSRKIKRRIRAALHQEKREQAFGLLSWAACREPRAFYTDRDLLNKNIFQEEAMDLSNDFYLSDMLSFDAYVEAVEANFESDTIVHEHDKQKWEKQKGAFLAQREAFYTKEKIRTLKEQKTRKEQLEKLLNPEEIEADKIEKRSVSNQSSKKTRSQVNKVTAIPDEEKPETKELLVDFDVLKEIELEEVENFQKEIKERHTIKKEKLHNEEVQAEQKRSMNQIFLYSLLPIVVMILAMSYYFSATKVEVKSSYPLFVNATPYDARIQILNIKPKYMMGIELKPGRYDIRISKRGYQSKRFWVTMEHKPVVVTKELSKIKKRKVY